MAENSVFTRTHDQHGTSLAGQIPANFLRKQGYKLGKVIGSGSYSKVHVAQQVLDNGEHIQRACKVINMRTASADFVKKFLPREIDAVRMIDHPNIVKFYNVFELKDFVYMFMEFCKKGDLLQHIQNHGVIEESRARIYFRQIVSAIQYLHSLEIAHRDLKCENVLMSDISVVKLTDFGFSRRLRDDAGTTMLSETFCGSKSYAAPEVLQNRPYNAKLADAWSLGCILHVMVTACLPFPESNVKKQIARQQAGLIGFCGSVKSSSRTHPLSETVKQLIRNILEPQIAARATVDRMARDTWTVSAATTSSAPPQHSTTTH